MFNLFIANMKQAILSHQIAERGSWRRPRTITGLEVLAKIIDPEGFQDIKVPADSFAKYEYN
jgi:hypothetical protein